MTTSNSELLLMLSSCRGVDRHLFSSCPKGVNTYNSHYPNAEKTLSQGGYSTAVRAHERFVFPIPSALALEEAAPMLCAGLTVYSPLVRNGAGYVNGSFVLSIH